MLSLCEKGLLSHKIKSKYKRKIMKFKFRITNFTTHLLKHEKMSEERHTDKLCVKVVPLKVSKTPCNHKKDRAKM